MYLCELFLERLQVAEEAAQQGRIGRTGHGRHSAAATKRVGKSRVQAVCS